METITSKPYILWTPRPNFTENLYNSEEPDIKQLAQAIKYVGGNTGNLVYLEGIRSLFPENTPITAWGTSPKDASCLIFPAANQLGAHTNLTDLAKFWNTKKKKTIVLGLGIQAPRTKLEISLQSGTAAWLDAIIAELKAESKFLICRGKITEKFINARAGIDVAVTAGCPSQFISSPKEMLPSIKAKLAAGLNTLTVNADDPCWKAGTVWQKYAGLEKKLIEEVVIKKGKYLIQAPTHLIVAGILNAKQYRFQEADYDIEKFSDFANSNFFRNYAHTFISVPNWKFCVEQYSYNVGTRIHGCMLALSAGVPSFLYSVDKRTEEFAETMQLPHSTDLTIADPIGYAKESLLAHDFEKMFAVWQEHAHVFHELLKSYDVTPSESFMSNWINS